MNPAATQDLQDIADYLLEQIRNECAGDEDYTYLILRVHSVFCVSGFFSEMLFLTIPYFAFFSVMGSCFFSSMQVIGNMGKTMEQVMPRLKSSVLKCIKSTKPSLLIQKAAIQALRKMELEDEVKFSEEFGK
jgi:apolipoprotein B